MPSGEARDLEWVGEWTCGAGGSVAEFSLGAPGIPDFAIVTHHFLTRPGFASTPGRGYTERFFEHPFRLIVAIDGPAGSGKSTTARRVADRLGWLYLDTGAMYRAVGLAFREAGAPFTDASADALVPGLDVSLDLSPGGVRVALGDRDVTGLIRTAQAAEDASRASALGAVREAMVDAQRRVAAEQAARGGGVVVEGRDIGTVVFPEAPVKFFLTADLDARARRRTADLGPDTDLAAVRAELAARDRRDAERALAPLRAAADALPLDTTELDIDQQVAVVLDAVRRVQQPS